MILPAAPASLLDGAGRPLLGRYAGHTGPLDWSQLAPPFRRGPLWRRFHHKRWHYVALYTERVFCAVAIVDLGWASTAFAYAFERSDGDMLTNFSEDGVPLLSARVADQARGASHFRTRRCTIEIAPEGAGQRLAVRSDYLEIDALLGPGAAPPLLACGPVQGGSVHATQKTGGLPLLGGAVRTYRDEFALAGGVASVDYSNGLLARRTAWRWASAHNLELGFNLQAGYFGAHENALWLDGQVHALGPAHFLYDVKDPVARWHIFTEDDQLDLYFTPEGARREQRRLPFASSRYVQPLGTFSGWVRSGPDQPKRIISQLPGVTEDHAARW
ncbi:DUF2804 domain-containing protein [Oxalobacteraceae bacterium A2-2]